MARLTRRRSVRCILWLGALTVLAACKGTGSPKTDAGDEAEPATPMADEAPAKDEPEAGPDEVDAEDSEPEAAAADAPALTLDDVTAKPPDDWLKRGSGLRLELDALVGQKLHEYSTLTARARCRYDDTVIVEGTPFLPEDGPDLEEAEPGTRLHMQTTLFRDLVVGPIEACDITMVFSEKLGGPRRSIGDHCWKGESLREGLCPVPEAKGEDEGPSLEVKEVLMQPVIILGGFTSMYVQHITRFRRDPGTTQLRLDLECDFGGDVQKASETLGLPETVFRPAVGEAFATAWPFFREDDPDAAPPDRCELEISGVDGREVASLAKACFRDGKTSMNPCDG